MATVYIGSRDTGISGGSLATGTIIVRPAALREDASLEAIGFYARTTVATTAIRGVLYEFGSDGKPGALIASTTELTATTASTYHELAFAAPVALSAGNYYLGIHVGGATVSAGLGAGVNLSYARTGVAYAGGAPNPFVAGSVNANNYHFYGRYTNDGTLDSHILGSATRTSQSPIAANTARASRFTLTEAATVGRLTFQVAAGEGRPTGRLRGMIYADTGTAAGALVAATEEQVGVWTMEFFDLWFPSPVALAAGSYYLAFHSDGETRAGYSAGIGTNVTASDTYADGPADPFGSASPFTFGQLMMYAPYTVDAAPPVGAPRVLMPIWIGL